MSKKKGKSTLNKIKKVVIPTTLTISTAALTMIDGPCIQPVVQDIAPPPSRTSATYDELPLSKPFDSKIEVIERKGSKVTLKVNVSGDNLEGLEFRWVAMGGSLKRGKTDTEVTWTLPEEDGIYQIQVIARASDDAISVDAVTLKV